MSLNTYTAGKSRSKDRSAWSVAFRHPLRSDSRGKPGLKMRRGLGTTDDSEADHLVGQLNEILADSSWWNVTRRHEATARFAKVVVDAFYDEIQAGQEDPIALREEAIPLPGKEDGYARVLLVGTTGAGKTSLLRQLIGSDPDADRFPSTAPAKTTISDIEIVQADGDLDAIVTFQSEFQVQASIEECVLDSCIEAFAGAADDKVIERLLNHRDQRFRLAYVLGPWREEANAEGDDWDFDESRAALDSSGDDTGSIEPSLLDPIDAEFRREQRLLVEQCLARIRRVTQEARSELARDLGIHLDAEDPDTVLELFEETLYHHADFAAIVHDLLEAVRTRFEFIEGGELQRGRSGWPRSWTYHGSDRNELIRLVRWFSSNYWKEFGRLVTPLVDGIRVRGPLFPAHTTTHSRLVLIDGQGLGHTADSASSVTTQLTRRFGEVDVILLVDNAKQPMQAAPLAVLRYAASSGHHAKLALVFSHFDLMKAANLKTPADRRAHVMASVMGALSSLRGDIGSPVVAAIERTIEERTFMLGGVDRAVSSLNPRAASYMREQLGALQELLASSIIPPPTPQARPTYDPTGLAFSVRDAVSRFMGPWLARLGLGSHGQLRKEHWTRLRALNRRIAGELDVEYDSLRPLADLVARMSEAISRFLDHPVAWSRPPSSEADAEAAISQIRQAVAAALHEVCRRRLIDAQLGAWRDAFDRTGRGSGLHRAQSFRSIYEAAAPLPDAVMTADTARFLSDVRALVGRAIEQAGGDLGLAPPT